MAIYSRQEFANECGVHASYIINYVNRSKIFVNEDNKIDTKNRENDEFLKRMIVKKALKLEALKEPTETDPKKESKKNNKPVKIDKAMALKIEQQEKEKQYLIEHHKIKHDLDLNKAKADLEKKEIDIRISLLNEAKLRGENLPTDEVKLMIMELSKSFINNYKDSFEKMIIEISHRNKLNVNEESKIKNDFINILNETHKQVFDDVKNTLSKIRRNATNTKVVVSSVD